MIDNPIYKSSSGVRVWLHCLLSATHTKHKIEFAGKEIELKVGEFIYGRYQWEKITRISPNTIENWINKLVKRNMIYVERRVRGYGSILGISKWEDYQTQRAIKRAMGERWASDGRAMGEYNKDKKDKKDKKGEKTIAKKKNKYSSLKNIKEQDMVEISQHYKVPLNFVKLQFEKMTNWCQAKDKRYKNYKRALMNWVLREAEGKVERGANEKYRAVDARHVQGL